MEETEVHLFSVDPKIFSVDPKTGLQESAGQLVCVCFCLYLKAMQQSQVFQA